MGALLKIGLMQISLGEYAMLRSTRTRMIHRLLAVSKDVPAMMLGYGAIELCR